MDSKQHLSPYLSCLSSYESYNPKTFGLRDIINNYRRSRHGLPTAWSYDLCHYNLVKHAWQRNLKGHSSCVNAVELSKSQKIFATGGDDLRVLIWRASEAIANEKPVPCAIMNKRHGSNIFCLAFDHDSKRVMSGGNDNRFIVHDVETGKPIRIYRGATYYSLSVHAENDNIVAAATDSSRVYLYDVRVSPNEPVQCLREVGENYCVNFNQKTPYLMAVTNKTKGLSVVDIRANSDYFIRAGPTTKEAIYASWNESGDALFCIRSGKLPVYFDTKKRVPLICKDERYRNSVTIKSCDFIGNEYAVTGSDKWDIYCWKIPKDYDDNIEPGTSYAHHPEVSQAYSVFSGHRSIVNHVRYSKHDDIMLSCGVEKFVKLWTVHKVPTAVKNPARRNVFPSPRHGGVREEPENQDDIENEDRYTLQLFDSYTHEEDTTTPYSTDTELPDDDGSPPPQFINENPHHVMNRNDALFERLLGQIVGGPILFGYANTSDSDEDDEEDNNDIDHHSPTFRIRYDGASSDEDYMFGLPDEPPMLAHILPSDDSTNDADENEPSSSNGSNDEDMFTENEEDNDGDDESEATGSDPVHTSPSPEPHLESVDESPL